LTLIYYITIYFKLTASIGSFTAYDDLSSIDNLKNEKCHCTIMHSETIAMENKILRHRFCIFHLAYVDLHGYRLEKDKYLKIPLILDSRLYYAMTCIIYKRDEHVWCYFLCMQTTVFFIYSYKRVH